MKEWALRLILIAAAFAAAVYFGTPPKRLPPTTSDCDLGKGACVQAFVGHDHAVELRVTPTPIAVDVPLVVSARIIGGKGHNPVVTFVGSEMAMPITKVALLPVGNGTFTAQTTLPICQSEQMRWVARLDVDVDGDAHDAAFGFVTRRADNVVAPASSSASSPSVTSLPPKPVEFSLQTKAGPLTLSSLQGKIVVVTFGYTYCPDICPTSLAATAAALKALTPEERANVVPVFVSVDPGRDSVDRLADYVAFFDGAYRGATGSDVDVKAAADVFGVFFERHVDDAGSANYLIDHTTRSYLVNQKGELVAAVAHGAPAADVDAAIRTLLHGGSL